MVFSEIHDKRLKAREGMVVALDNYLDGKVDEHEFKLIISDYESLVNKILEDDYNAAAYDNYEEL